MLTDVQCTVPHRPECSTELTMARLMVISSPWRLSSSTPATRATSPWASLTPSVSSTTPRPSGSDPTSPANVRSSLATDKSDHSLICFLHSHHLWLTRGYPSWDPGEKMSDIWLPDLLHLRARLPASRENSQILPGGRVLEPSTSAGV